MEASIYIVIYGAVLLFTCVLMAGSARKFHTRIFRAFFFLCLTMTIWSFFVFLRLIPFFEPVMLQLNHAKYFGIAAMPPALLIFTLEYAGYRSLITRRNIILLMLVPVTTAVIAMTDPWLGLFSVSTVSSYQHGILVIESQRNIWFYVHIVYSYLLGMASIGVVLVSMKRRASIFLAREITFLSGILLPLVVDCLRVVHLLKSPLDVTPVSFFYAASALYWAAYITEDSDVVSMAIRQVVDTMDSPVIIANEIFDVLYVNKRASELGNQFGHQLEGKSVPGYGSGTCRFPSLREEAMLSMENRGRHVTFQVMKQPIFDQQHKMLAHLFMLNDVTQLQNAMEDLTEMAQTDPLTGLANRHSFEMALEIFADKQYLPLTVMVGDANGLKLANDIFGHAAGDGLLRSIAGILRRSVRDKDIVARIGGDEFAMILPHTSWKEAEAIIARMSDHCNRENSLPVKPSIAFGYATRDDLSQSMQEIFSQADSRMYHTKTAMGRHFRAEMLGMMVHRMVTGGVEAPEHLDGVRDLCLSMGRALEMPEDQLETLSLLVQYHDIGKLSMDKGILNKKGVLTPEEWSQIRQHPEKSWNVLKSLQDRPGLATAALLHHENWDGTGYPRGVMGEDIPLISRILRLADSMDMMRRERPYGHPEEEAEIRRRLLLGRETLYDPALTDLAVRLFFDDVDKTVEVPPEKG